MNRLRWLLVTPLLLAAGPALSPETRTDIRCMLAMAGLTEHSDPAIKMAAMAGGQYYFGRVDSRVPALDLEQAMLAEATTLTDAEIPLLLKSCGERMKAHGQDLMAIGKRMQDKAARTPAKAS